MWKLRIHTVIISVSSFGEMYLLEDSYKSMQKKKKKKEKEKRKIFESVPYMKSGSMPLT